MIIGINITLAVLILFTIWWFWLYKPKGGKVVTTGKVTIEVAGGVYKPDIIRVQAGQTLRLQIILKDDAGCARTLLFPELQVSKELIKDKTVELTITPDKVGEYSFACPMNMYKGKLIVTEPAPQDIIIAAGAYQPSQIQARVGQQIQLRFIRKDPSKCAEVVNFPDFNIAEEIPLAEPKVIRITPTKPGEYPFSCSMGMYRGKLIVTNKS